MEQIQRYRGCLLGLAVGDAPDSRQWESPARLVLNIKEIIAAKCSVI